MARSRKLAAAALAAGLLALTGCYGDKPAAEQAPTGLALLSADAEGSVRTAAETTAKAKSVRVAVDGTVNGRRVNSQGVVSFGPPLAAELTASGLTAVQVTARIVDTAAYVRIPPEFQSRAGGKGWLKADLAAAARVIGIDADELTSQLRNADPSTHAKALLASGDLKAVGEETVDGVRTVHYAGTTPVTTYLQNVDAASRAAVQRELAERGITEVRTDLWVDEKYQVRKAKAVVGKADLTVRFTDYDKPVTVVAPAAAETVDIASLISQFVN